MWTKIKSGDRVVVEYIATKSFVEFEGMVLFVYKTIRGIGAYIELDNPRKGLEGSFLSHSTVTYWNDKILAKLVISNWVPNAENKRYLSCYSKYDKIVELEPC